MKICFPVQRDEGIDSSVYNHFGSAPFFMVVDTESNSVVVISNRDQHHAHGACNPMKALDNHHVDAIVVGGIGAGALSRLQQMGISVHKSQAATVRDNIALFTAHQLPALTMQGCGGGHSADRGCAH